MSPQHVAQVMKKKPLLTARGLVCKNDAKECQLRWNDGANVRTVPIDPSNNCFTFRLAPGFKYFMAYCAKFDLDTGSNNSKSLIAGATLIEDKEDEVQKAHYPMPWIPIVDEMKQPYSLSTPAWGDQQNDQWHVIVPNEDDGQNGKMEPDCQLLLNYHHQFGHVSFQ
jgi:hypothetical protein